MNKKSQIGVAVIVGFVLLILAVVIYYINNFAKEDKTEIEKKSIEAPFGFEKVKNYVESCIRSVGVESLVKIGEHGGYIDMTDTTLSGKSFDFYTDEPSNSDGMFIGKSGLPIAYWWHLKSDNECLDCVVSSSAASLEDISTQIEKYVNSNLGECIQDFSSLRQENYVFENFGELSSSVDIAENDVVVHVFYPFTAIKDKTEGNFKDFIVNIELNLKEIVELSSFISQHESNDQFLEKILLYLISSYSGRDSGKLPPFTYVDHEYFTLAWNKFQVEENLKNILSLNIPIIDIAKTKNALKLEDEEFKIFFLDFLAKSYDIEVDFDFLNFPIFLKITPENNNILQPSITRQNFPLNVAPPSETNYYEFYYDVSFPVLVTLTYKNDRVNSIFGNQGYKFMFSLEGNIRDNIDLLHWHEGEGTIGQINFDNADFSFRGESQENRESFFCNPEQRLSGDISVKAYNGNAELDKVSLTFGCGNYRACSLGETAFDVEKSEFLFEGKFPICEGGYLLLEKEGFMKKAIPLTTKFNRKDKIDVFMQPFQKKLLNIKKYVMSDTDSCCGVKHDLSENDLVMMSVDKINNPNEPFDYDYSQFFMIDKGNVNFSDNQVINLIPGDYEITINYMDNNGFVIEKNCKEYCSKFKASLFGKSSCAERDYLPKESIEVKPAPLGGAFINQETGFWRVSDAQLKSGKNIEFYFIQNAKPTCIDKANAREEKCMIEKCIGLEETSKTEQNSKSFRDYLEPRIY